MIVVVVVAFAAVVVCVPLINGCWCHVSSLFFLLLLFLIPLPVHLLVGRPDITVMVDLA